MARRSITLICETCGESFEARAHRRVELCQACAQGLRLKGMGLSITTIYDPHIAANIDPPGG